MLIQNSLLKRLSFCLFLISSATALIPVDQAKLSFDNQQVLGVTDFAGTLPFSGAPGDYLVIAGGKDDPWPPNMEAIQARMSTAPRIHLKPGDNKIVTVTVR